MTAPGGNEWRVLVVTPTGRDAELMCEFLAGHGLEPVACPTIPRAVTELAEGAGALLLADEACRDGQVAPLLAAISQQPPWSDLPVLLLTLAGSTPAAGDAELKAMGNVTVIERPVGGGPLLSAVQSALRARGRQYEVRNQLEELEEAGRELRAANARKDELLALVSHELRTPLTLMTGSAELLLRRGEDLARADRDELLGSMLDNGERLRRVIENMLVLAKAETVADVIVEPVLVQRLVPPLLQALAPLQGCRDLRSDIPEALPPALANELFLEQIIHNLVRNSEKYAAPGQPVELSAAAEDAAVVVSVADRGRVFEQQQVDQMFESFYRDPETSARVSGLGLGLPVCRRLAEVQGGSIAAAPREGGGIVVSLRLPAVGG
jgi:signal transduction histidine kinase